MKAAAAASLAARPGPVCIDMRVQLPVSRSGLALSTGMAWLLLACTAPAAAGGYACTPTAKLSCHDQHCRYEPAGSFEHAESFSYDSDTTLLGACLWTACYEGRATTLDAADGIVAAAALRSEDGRRMHLTLAIGSDRRFTAVWDVTGSGATVDMGSCDTRPDAAPPEADG